MRGAAAAEHVTPQSMTQEHRKNFRSPRRSKMADTCGQVVLGSGLTVLSHPLMYIKVLIQVSAAGPGGTEAEGELGST